MKVIKLSPTTKTYQLNRNEGEITVIPNFISIQESDALYNHLLTSLPWIQGEYSMFGKPIKPPRLLWALRDPDYDISHAYDVTGSFPWTTDIIPFKNRIESHLNLSLRYAQLNYYRNGTDYIGWHTDSEVGDGDKIISLSIGTPRKFCLRHKKYRTEPDIPKYEIILNPGTLLVMNKKAATDNWKHTLPKQKPSGINRLFNKMGTG